MAKTSTYKCDLCQQVMSAERPMAGFRHADGMTSAVSVKDADLHLCRGCLINIRKITDPNGSLGGVIKL